MSPTSLPHNDEFIPAEVRRNKSHPRSVETWQHHGRVE